jgi:hypothetical protein
VIEVQETTPILEVVAEKLYDTPDFESMTKLEIDIWANKTLGIRLDRRRKREHMITEIHNHLNKEN